MTSDNSLSTEGITKLAISLIVGVIIVGCVLVPVISDAEHTMSTKTYSNAVNAIEVLDEIDGDDTYTIEYEDSAYTLNGNAIYMCRIYTNQGYFFINSNTISAGFYVIGDVKTTSGTNISYTPALKSIVLTSDSLTVVDTDDVESTTTIEWGYITVPNGSWCVVQNSDVYCNEVSQLKYLRPFGIYLAVMEGDEAYYQNQTFSDFVNATELNDGQAYVATLPFVISDSWTTYEVIAPISFEVQIPNNSSGLLSVIPILVVVTLVVAAASAIVVRKD